MGYEVFINNVDTMHTYTEKISFLLDVLIYPLRTNCILVLSDQHVLEMYLQCSIYYRETMFILGSLLLSQYLKA